MTVETDAQPMRFDDRPPRLTVTEHPSITPGVAKTFVVTNAATGARTTVWLTATMGRFAGPPELLCSCGAKFACRCRDAVAAHMARPPFDPGPLAAA